MTDSQVEAILIEVLRITRGFGEVIRLISEQRAEIIALRKILEEKNLATAEEVDAACQETLKLLNSEDQHDAPPAIDLLQQSDDSKWKM